MANDDSDALPGLRVVAHPLRLQLLSLLSGTAMSAAEAARELNQTQANVSYHLRRLQAAGLLVPVEEVSIRGGKAKRYRHPADSAEQLRTVHAADHQQLASAMASELVRRSHNYRPDSQTVFTDAQFAVRRGDWEEAKSLARRLGWLLHNSAVNADGGEANTDSSRSIEHPAAAVKISATLLLFELLDGPKPDGGVVSDAGVTSGGSAS